MSYVTSLPSPQLRRAGRKLMRAQQLIYGHISPVEKGRELDARKALISARAALSHMPAPWGNGE